MMSCSWIAQIRRFLKKKFVQDTVFALGAATVGLSVGVFRYAALQAHAEQRSPASTAQRLALKTFRTPQLNPAATNAALTSSAPLHIRVLLNEELQFDLAASAPAIIQTVNNAQIAQIQEFSHYRVQNNAAGISINGQSMPRWVRIVPTTENAILYLNGNGYRGSLLLVNIGNRLAAINEVELERYVASVTGSEMYADWSIEALKAQAIAARGYAVFHALNLLNPYYDLCASEQCQMYKGISAETAATQWATFATQNTVLASLDGKVVLPQYSANREISQKAHNGRGMPQIEAQHLARQGWNYLAILNRYYPNTTLATVIPKS